LARKTGCEESGESSRLRCRGNRCLVVEGDAPLDTEEEVEIVLVSGLVEEAVHAQVLAHGIVLACLRIRSSLWLDREVEVRSLRPKGCKGLVREVRELLQPMLHKIDVSTIFITSSINEHSNGFDIGIQTKQLSHLSLSIIAYC
jgi:hypothetical protein